jgi:hypothetical protein
MPGAMVDLAKPAFKYGLTEVQVGIAGHELKVSVAPAKASYQVRDKAQVQVKVRMPDGKPAPAGTEVAFAAVDQALLELQPNLSWKLLEAMYARRGYGVETATAQMQVIGKRHYGRKAVAQGGGGGRMPTRELFDTLLLWNPRLALDANGEAMIEVPLNDSLTRFALVAVADVGSGAFGTGSGSVSVVQDLQIIAGLPPIVRGGDDYRAGVTLRNTTARAMRVALEAKVDGAALPGQRIDLPPGEAREAGWPVKVSTEGEPSTIVWEIAAREEGGAARDAMRVSQRRLPLVPTTVQQATLLQLAGTSTVRVAPPAGALPGRGDLFVALAPRLGGSNAGVVRYFEDYAFTCLEQKVSRAIGLADRAQWAKVVDKLPLYLDDDGLARYFPGEAPGSDVLTAYILAAANESGFVLPEPIAERMLAGLSAFVDARIQRSFWSPRADQAVRKLAALEALSRYRRAVPRQLESIAIEPNTWPTGAVIDWLAILNRMPAIAERDAGRVRAEQVLRARLDFTGTRLVFSTETDDAWWWLMESTDANAGKLVLAVLDSPQWRADLPKLATGLLGRQVRGHWSTTTANVWGSLALAKFSAAFEKEAVTGRSSASLEGTSPSTAELDWRRKPEGGTLRLPWGSVSAASPGELRLAQVGDGKPWVTIQSLAAVPLAAPQFAGYQIARTVEAVEQKDRAAFSRGDIVRVRLAIDARSDMTWVVVSDPVPAGASILGSGLSRDSQLATRDEKRGGGGPLPAFEEKAFDVFRAYYAFVPKGQWTLEYTLRLNNEGSFGMPPTRVEAMYAPEMFGELPNAVLVVKP